MKSSHINHIIALAGMCAAAGLWHCDHPFYWGAATIVSVAAWSFALNDREDGVVVWRKKP